ncbi:uncharacterized protein LOC113563108 [Ooceraea biroi]|uniref:uncharacterized protein LOC113563108 n=1 Tax=Ooceraea biroi TaxID=2015173 RepID=UPI000F07F1B8|nr:uncharacterized protein LOC113563108 [Ooceraea biroi]
MPEPTENIWKVSAEKFRDLWQFPNCVAAIDGKYIALQCPIGGGSKYFNYKGFHSEVLLALIDTEYRFIAIDVSAYGKNSDSNVFSTSVIGKKLEDKTLNIPRDTPLVENYTPMPYVIVGDEAFPLKTYLLRPYSRHHLAGDEEKKIIIDYHGLEGLLRMHLAFLLHSGESFVDLWRYNHKLLIR